MKTKEELIIENVKLKNEFKILNIKYEKLFNNINEGVAVYEVLNSGEDFIFKDFNSAGENIENVKIENLIGKKVTEAFPGVKEFGLFKVFQQVAIDKKTRTHPIRLYQDEKISGWRDNIVYSLSKNEIVAVYYDKTKEMRYLEEIKIQKEFNETLIDTSNTIVVLLDKNCLIKKFNKYSEVITGYKYKEVINKNWMDIFIPKDIKENMKNICNQAMNNGKLHKEYINPIVCKDGSQKIINWNNSIIKQKDKIFVLSIGTDITEVGEYRNSLEIKVKEEIEKRRAGEQLLIQQSKMVSMGEMMSAVAHQWRQPLNVLGLVIQSFILKYEDGVIKDKDIEDLENTTLKELEFMSKTIDSFKNFFKPTEEKEFFDIKKAILNVINLLSAQLKDDFIEIELIDKNPNKLIDYLAYGHPNEFEHALLHILHNSKEAILNRRKKKELKYKSGKISIKLTNLDKKLIIEVVDNGIGIKKDIIDKIFEPYFSTKFSSQGTGIGLYMVKMLIEKDMKGLICVENIKGGAKFTIEILKNKGLK